jgi:hypothetical protein
MAYLHSKAERKLEELENTVRLLKSTMFMLKHGCPADILCDQIKLMCGATEPSKIPSQSIKRVADHMVDAAARVALLKSGAFSEEELEVIRAQIKGAL